MRVRFESKCLFALLIDFNLGSTLVLVERDVSLESVKHFSGGDKSEASLSFLRLGAGFLAR